MFSFVKVTPVMALDFVCVVPLATEAYIVPASMKNPMCVAVEVELAGTAVVAKFYVNEVLKATITTNLPASNGPAIYIGATGQDGQDLIMELFNNYFISTII